MVRFSLKHVVILSIFHLNVVHRMSNHVNQRCNTYRVTPQPRFDREHVLFYDHECKVCRAIARATWRLTPSRRFGIVPFKDARFATWFAHETDAERAAGIHLVELDEHGIVEQTWSNGDAFIVVVQHFRGMRTIGQTALRIDLVRKFVGYTYRLFAKHRSRFARFVKDYETFTREPHE